MKKILCLLAVLTVIISSACKEEMQEKPYNKGINIIPRPAELTETGGKTFKLNAKTVFFIAEDSLKTVAEFFRSKLKASTGFDLKITEDLRASNCISLLLNGEAYESPEAYRLAVNAQQVKIEAASAHGLFYGLQTFLQLLPAEVESSETVKGIRWEAPAVEISDAPAFPYRGMLIDVCRHFVSVEGMKKHIDMLSMLKVNKLHWHLTEDQGWRVEIKQYPELTEKGAVRTEGDGSQYGPYFYTQEEIKEVVAYAAERFVEIIPEIEMPGHALAALTAYPELACFPKEFKVRNIWGVEEDVYCAGKEEVFEFLENVLTELIPLFPSRYFHIGGDECPKARWKKCPLCQKRIRAEKLKDEHELQTYFITRIGRFLEEKGKAMIGWDEILEGGIPPSAIVMSWRGEEGGLAAAAQGHEVIMTPGNKGLYLDHYQDEAAVEPVAIGGYAPLEKTYAYYPIPDSLAADKRHYVLGAQGNLWGEYFYTEEQLEYMAYPRMAAVAELCWTQPERKDFQDFSRRIENLYVRMDMHDTHYHIPMPLQENGSLNYIEFTDSLELHFKTSRPIKMVYTIGSKPHTELTEYTKPLVFKSSKLLHIASILPSGKQSKTRVIELNKRDHLRAADLPYMKTEEETLSQGLKLYYTAETLPLDASIEDVPTDKLQISYISDPKEAAQPLYSKDSQDYHAYTTMTEAYLKIDEPGIYVFHTDADAFYLNAEKLIDNTERPAARFSGEDVALALDKGYHRVRLLTRGNVRGGWPSAWIDSRLFMKKYGEKALKPIDPAKYFTAKL